MGGFFSGPKIKEPKVKPEEESEEAKVRERARRRNQKMLSTSIFAGKNGGTLGQAPVSKPQVFGQ